MKKIRKTREYLDYNEEHYNNVQKDWVLIQDKCKDMRFIYDEEHAVINRCVVGSNPAGGAKDHKRKV